MMRTPYYIQILALLLVAVLVGLYIYGKNDSSVAASDTPPRLSQETKEVFQGYWAERIQRHGGAAAYTMFKEAYPEGSSAALLHSEAHVFAGELYKIEGVEGIAICDEQYAYACHHEFLSQSILENGLPFIEKLYEICAGGDASNSPPTTCRHGIGHGIISYIGYESEDLEEALSYCSKLPEIDPISGCYGGVFMEYNMRTILNQYMSGDAENPLRPVGADLREPCISLPEQYRGACYYQQTQWWWNVLEGAKDADPELLYTNIGDQCDRVQDDAHRRACFEGVGKILQIGTTSDIPELIRLCDAAASDSESELYCRSVVANMFHIANGTEPDRTAELCAGFEGQQYQYCAAHSVNDCSSIAEAGEHHWHFCSTNSE